MVKVGEVWRAQFAKSTLLTSMLCPWDLFRSFKVCSDVKREWSAETNRKLQHLSIPSKTTAWFTEFAVEDLPLSRTAALVPEFAVKDLPLGRIF